MRSEKQKSVAVMRVVVGGVLCAALIALAMWISGSGDVRDPGVVAGVKGGGNAVQTTGGEAGAKPWTPGGGDQQTGESASSATAGETPAPSVPTPVLDAWLAANMDKGDAEFTAGLLAFAEDEKQTAEERVAALNHALNMLPDKDYSRLGPLLEAKTTPGAMLRQILANAHNRSERAAVWASMSLMARDEAEIASEGRELLAFLLDLDATSDSSSLKLQGETRLLELDEAAAGKAPNELPVSKPDDSAPPGS